MLFMPHTLRVWGSYGVGIICCGSGGGWHCAIYHPISGFVRQSCTAQLHATTCSPRFLHLHSQSAGF